MSEQLQNPFVIQCINCKEILGDSFFLLDYKNDWLLFSSLHSSVIVSEENKESLEEFDYKCNYNDLFCKCNTVVGKKYVTVNKNLSEFVNKFGIFRSKIISYQLGNSSVKEHSLSSLAEEISKLEKFCVYLHNKIEKNKK